MHIKCGEISEICLYSQVLKDRYLDKINSSVLEFILSYYSACTRSIKVNILSATLVHLLYMSEYCMILPIFFLIFKFKRIHSRSTMLEYWLIKIWLKILDFNIYNLFCFVANRTVCRLINISKMIFACFVDMELIFL